MIDQNELFHALIEGAKQSRCGKDPQHPEAEGSLTRFMTAIANQHPQVFCALLGELLQLEANSELNVEPQRHAEKRLQ